MPVEQVGHEPDKAASDTPQGKRAEGSPQDSCRDLGGKASRRHTAEFDTKVNPRERFQAWISDTEERFREFIEILKECLIFVDEDLRFSHTNAQFPKLLGYERNEVVGHYVVEYLDAENRTLFLTHTERQRRGMGSPYELIWLRKDGGKIPTLIAPRAITNLQGAVKGFFSVVTDITELKQATASAQEMEETARALLDATADSAVLLEPDGTIIALNNPMADMLGKRAETLTGVNWYDFVPPNLAPVTKKRSNEVLISGKISNFVTNYKGEWYDTRRYPVLDDTGKAYRLAIYIRNIIEKKRAELMLEEREKQLKHRENQIQEMNAALHVLLEKRIRDKEELEEREFVNVRKLILPKIERIKRSVKDEVVRNDLESLEKKLQDIISPFALKMTSSFVGLTSTEIRIADLVREGKSSKEIAGMFHLSVKTISAHRENIRKKLAIKNTKTNLRTHLLTLFTYNV